jgi:hypothetical protein
LGLTRKLLLALNFGAILMGLVRPGRAADAAATQPTPASPTTLPADQPAERVGPAGHPNPRPLALHNSFLDRAWQAPVGLLFIGDSITERWRNAPDVWKAHYWQYAPANFGVAGDRTENVLWRIDNGELDHVDPKLVVLMIGTNNINDTPEHIVAADVKIAGLMHQKLPAAKLLVMGLLPRGHDATDPRRQRRPGQARRRPPHALPGRRPAAAGQGRHAPAGHDGRLPPPHAQGVPDLGRRDAAHRRRHDARPIAASGRGRPVVRSDASSAEQWPSRRGGVEAACVPAPRGSWLSQRKRRTAAPVATAT